MVVEESTEAGKDSNARKTASTLFEGSEGKTPRTVVFEGAHVLRAFYSYRRGPPSDLKHFRTIATRKRALLLTIIAFSPHHQYICENLKAMECWQTGL